MDGRHVLTLAAASCAGALTAVAAWDGQSWVYDTSRRVEPVPQVREAAFDDSFEGRSGDCSDGLLSFLEARIRSLARSNEVEIDFTRLGLYLMIR